VDPDVGARGEAAAARAQKSFNRKGRKLEEQFKIPSGWVFRVLCGKTFCYLPFAFTDG
jgi:hypothetical protein